LFDKLTAADRINGGGGSNDVVTLNGDYTAGHAVSFNATTMVNVEKISLAAGHSYNLTTADQTVATGGTFTVDGHTLAAGSSLTFNGAAELDGHFTFFAGGGGDTIVGGAQSDLFELTLGGNDTVLGGGGDDLFEFASQLTSADKINGGAGYDRVSL